jgi:hypothetical protein
MNYKLHQLKLGIAALNSHSVRIALVIISFILFVLGAGAPEGGGIWGG